MPLKANVLQKPIPEPRAPSPKPEAPNDKTPQNIERRKDKRRSRNRRGAQTKYFAENHAVFKEHESGQEAFIVKSGTVEIFRTVTEDNVTREILLGTLGEGAIFGEMALIDNQPRMASARASGGPLVVYVIDKEQFQSLLDVSNPFVQKLLEILTKHIRSNSEHIKT